MADYTAPGVYPYIDNATALLSSDFNPMIAALVDLGGATGRVHTLETAGVRAVVVVTGSEARPAAGVVLWISPDAITPTHAIATDLVFLADVTAPDTTPPTTPTGLAASSITDTTFTLNWTASTDAVGVTGYEVEVGGSVVGTPSTNTFGVTGRTASTNYSVRVRARDAAANWSGWGSISGGVTTAAGPSSPLFADTFNRANGAVGNGWTGPVGSVLNIVSNALTFASWDDYNQVYQSGLPKQVSVRAIFTGTLASFQGIFLGHSANVGVKLFNLGGTWVIGDSSAFDANNTNVSFSGTPSTPYTTLRLDLTGTTVTAYINGTLVHTATLAALGITLDTNGASVYRAGYCGVTTAPGLDNFEVWLT